MFISKLLSIIDDEQKIEIGSDWQDVEYSGLAKDCNPRIHDDLYSRLGNLVSSIRLKENDVLRIEYHVYDSHSCDNYVPHLGFKFVTPYDILLVVGSSVLINGYKANKFIANEEIITSEITNLKVSGNQIFWTQRRRYE